MTEGGISLLGFGYFIMLLRLYYLLIIFGKLCFRITDNARILRIIKMVL